MYQLGYWQYCHPFYPFIRLYRIPSIGPQWLEPVHPSPVSIISSKLVSTLGIVSSSLRHISSGSRPSLAISAASYTKCALPVEKRHQRYIHSLKNFISKVAGAVRRYFYHAFHASLSGNTNLFAHIYERISKPITLPVPPFYQHPCQVCHRYFSYRFMARCQVRFKKKLHYITIMKFSNIPRRCMFPCHRYSGPI